MLPGGIIERWNRKVLTIRRCQVREPTLDDMTDFIEEETILMNDLFSCEVFADYHTKLECLVRQMRMKNYTIKAEDEIRKMGKGHQMIAVLNGRCVMGRMTLMNVKPSMT